MKTINIYLTRTEKTQADKVRSKYKVSLSTLTGVVVLITYDLLHKNNEVMLEHIENKYIAKEGNYKTSIKPRELMETLGEEIKNKNIFATNCLKIYLNKAIKEYLEPEKVNLYYARIDKTLNEKFDTYWDYNCSIRNQRRMLKQNKEYWKKALETI